MQVHEEKESEAAEQQAQMQLVEPAPGALTALLAAFGVGIACIVIISMIALFGVHLGA